MKVYEEVHSKILQAVEHVAKEESWPEINLSNINLEIPNDSRFGELSTNAAMIIAPQIKKQVLDIAKSLKTRLDKDHIFFNVSFVPNGFINFILKPHAWQKELITIIEKGDLYAQSNLGENKRINIEYASPNPTGPMHIGHARGAIYGDALSSLLSYVGYKVTRECYINDAGNQVDTVAESIYLRYLELHDSHAFKKFPENFYPGEYIIEAAKKLQADHGDKLVNAPKTKWHPILREFAIKEMLALIKKDLHEMGVTQDVLFYESHLHQAGRLTQLIEALDAKGLVYKGSLEDPKSGIKAQSGEELLLFKATTYGDDIDRALKKSDGTWTYFAADSAYLADKLNRKFNELILVLGADHVGYKKRLEAMCMALNGGKCILDVKLCQMVVYLQNGKPLKMSKRAGNFVSVEQILKLVGKDILRFMMLTRKNDAGINFDVEKVQEQSKDNPVFYVQYAHARGCSVLANASNEMPNALKKAKESWNNVRLDLLNTEAELDLMRLLSYWPRQVKSAAINHDPTRLITYLQTLAGKFHAFWTVGKGSHDLRFIVQNNEELTSARLILVMATLTIISSGLNLVGVKPVSKM